MSKIVDRRSEKEASRREDEERIARGERVENGFFNVLDRSRARLIERRRNPFEQARDRFKNAAAALAASNGQIDEQMLDDDEIVIVSGVEKSG